MTQSVDATAACDFMREVADFPLDESATAFSSWTPVMMNGLLQSTLLAWSAVSMSPMVLQVGMGFAPAYWKKESLSGGASLPAFAEASFASCKAFCRAFCAFAASSAIFFCLGDSNWGWQCVTNWFLDSWTHGLRDVTRQGTSHSAEPRPTKKS